MFPSSHSFDLTNDPAPFPTPDMDKQGRTVDEQEPEKLNSKKESKEQGSPFSLFGELSPLHHPMQSPQRAKGRMSNDQQSGINPFDTFGSPGSSPLPIPNRKSLSRHDKGNIHLPMQPTNSVMPPHPAYDSRRMTKPSPPQQFHRGMPYSGSHLSGLFPSPGSPFTFQVRIVLSSFG